MNIKKTVDVLGTKYKIVFHNRTEDAILSQADGYCDWSSKTIVICRNLDSNIGNIEYAYKKILRHELTHAVLHESGLDVCTGETTAWALNEEMVDFFSIQGPKLYQIWVKAGAV